MTTYYATTVTTSSGDDCIFWGGLELDESESTGHFLCVGSPGSGKTVSMRLLLQSVLPRVGTGRDMRALIYDAKQDVLPILHAFCDPAYIRTLNPFDARGVAWDMQRDIREARVAVEFAFTLIPREHESQPFFSDAARHLLYGVIISFMLSGHEWTFADLLRGLATPRRLKAILKAHPETRDIIKQYFYDQRLISNIMSTLATKFLAFAPIAAAWDSAKERVSLEDWIRDEQILVLGNAETSRTAINAINRCLFKRASDLTLQQTESFTRRSWFIVDETSEAGKLDGLVSLLKKGRSKGACIAIAFQSISGLRDASMYGPQFTDEILGQIANRFFGRIECPETAEWASRLFGDQEIVKASTSEAMSTLGGTTWTTTQTDTVQRTVLPAEFMTIEPCNSDNGLSGYGLVRSVGCYAVQLPAEDLFDNWLIPMDAATPEFIAREAQTQFIRPWSPVEAKKFAPAPLRQEPTDMKRRPSRRKSLNDRSKDIDEFLP